MAEVDRLQEIEMLLFTLVREVRRPVVHFTIKTIYILIHACARDATLQNSKVIVTLCALIHAYAQGATPH